MIRGILTLVFDLKWDPGDGGEGLGSGRTDIFDHTTPDLILKIGRLHHKGHIQVIVAIQLRETISLAPPPQPPGSHLEGQMFAIAG